MEAPDESVRRKEGRRKVMSRERKVGGEKVGERGLKGRGVSQGRVTSDRFMDGVFLVSSGNPTQLELRRAINE